MDEEFEIPNEIAAPLQISDPVVGQVDPAELKSASNRKYIEKTTRYADKIIYPITKVFGLSTFDRKLMVNGPKINIIGDRNVVIRESVPKRALAASCTKVYDLLQIKPFAACFRIHGPVDLSSIKIILDAFTTEEGIQGKPADLATNDYIANLHMYQACQYLGLLRGYTKSLVSALCNEISSRLLSKDELNMTMCCVRSHDPVFKHLAHDLCLRRFRKEIFDLEAFNKWVGRRKALLNMMSEIDSMNWMRRLAIKSEKEDILLDF